MFRLFQISYFVVLTCGMILTASINFATAESQQEKAISYDPSDAQLKWSPCPPLFPEGCEVAVLHGDPGKGRSDVFLRSPADYTFPPHWHTSPEHIVLISGELQVTYEGQPTSTLKPGSYAYGPAKMGHKAYCTDAGSCVLFIAFESPIDAEPFTGSLE